MAKRRGRTRKQPVIDEQDEGASLEKKDEALDEKQPVINGQNEEGASVEKKDEAFDDSEVERQCAAIRALRDVEIEQFLTTLRLIRSYFSKDQLQVPVLQFFKENFPDLSFEKTGKDDRYEVKWKEKDVKMTLDHADERTLHAALLRRLSLAYPDFSAGNRSLGGFEFSNQSVKTSVFGADKLQIRSLGFDEPSDSQALEPMDGLRTPNVGNNGLSIGMTPKTRRLPKYGEMILSVHGSPLGVFKEDNMETIQEIEDG